MTELDPRRIERLRNEIASLKAKVAMVQSLRQAEAGVMEYLRNQTEAVDEDRIHAAVKNRRVILLKALRRLLADGKVIRTGAGKKASPYRYAVPENQNDEQQGSNAGTGPFDCFEHSTETRESAFRRS
jgi:hypothetical protein